MSCIGRCLLRWGLIGGLALGGATLLIGPERVAAGFSHLQSKAQNVVDLCVDDPAALRHQLAELAEDYPDRIAEVRGEIAKIDHQLTEYGRDLEIAERVVAMTTDDLSELKALVNRAETAREGETRQVMIRYDGARYDLEQAYVEANRVSSVRETYRDRLATDRQQSEFLTQQRGRLNDILVKLEREYDTYRAQLWQLDRQIDAIERNDRLIELTEQQKATLAGYEKFGKVGNLKQIEGKLAELRAVQEAQLQELSRRGVSTDYERQAEFELNAKEFDMADPFEGVEPKEISDEDADAQESESGRTMAWNGGIVVIE